jgi:hypothetical protein
MNIPGTIARSLIAVPRTIVQSLNAIPGAIVRALPSPRQLRRTRVEVPGTIVRLCIVLVLDAKSTFLGTRYPDRKSLQGPFPHKAPPVDLYLYL